MKFKDLETVAIYGIFVFGVCWSSTQFNQSYCKNKQKDITCIHDTVYVEKNVTDWQMLTLAITEVESNLDKEAKNNNAVGILQITPEYVMEANRCQDKLKFSLKDRHDPKKSIEMFNAVNNYHNKERSVEKAIKLHNPTASYRYSDKIKENLKRLKKEENVRKYIVEK